MIPLSLSLSLLYSDLPSPTNLVMSHYSPSCLLIQWDPPSNTPPCTRPLIQWPGIVGYNIYVDGQQEGMVSFNLLKLFLKKGFTVQVIVLVFDTLINLVVVFGLHKLLTSILAALLSSISVATILTVM